MKPKILAYHLPAYHRIPENDKWHGEGFTEWVTTKKGIAFSKDQYQPRVPLDANYYNLSNIDDLAWECQLAKKYGVDGFCFYHYWFDGKLIFEKPTEMLLDRKDINIDFCFAWANEEWRNTWTEKLDEPELLLAQNYESDKDWDDHFKYLLRFFKDERYIKIDNKPVLMIYRIEKIPNYEQRFLKWIDLAKEEGLDGLYIIQMINNDFSRDIKSPIIDSKVDFEPVKTFASREKYAFSKWRFREALYNKLVRRTFLFNHIFNSVDYAGFCKSLLRKKYTCNANYYYSAVVDWDNTARKGKRGWFMKKSSPLIFKRYIQKIYSLTCKENKEFIFIFAWNEWGEGAYLEPDTRNKYGYLEAVKKVVEDN